MKFLLVMFFAATALLVWSQNAAVETAWGLASKGQTDEAIQLLREEIREHAKDADARLLLGSLFMEKGYGSECIAELTEAVKLRPKSADAQNALGEAYNKFGNPKMARAPLEEAVRIKPTFGVAHLNLGQALLQLSEYTSAAAHLDQAIALLGKDPEAAYAHYLRAKAYSALGDSKNASLQLETAVSMRPNYSEAWADLGEAKRLLLDDSGALAAEKRAVELNPNDAIAQYRLGAGYLRLDQPQSALAPLREAYRLNPKDQSTLNALQQALRQTGNVEEAANVKNELTALLREKDKDNQDSLTAIRLNNEAVQLEQAGDLTGATDKYRQALKLYPEHVGIRVNYAVSLLRTGKWTDGLNELHEALQRDPTNTTIQSALNDALKQAPAGTVPKWDKQSH
jgi:tetratricopeptide (TPR) repeat protein